MGPDHVPGLAVNVIKSAEQILAELDDEAGPRKNNYPPRRRPARIHLDICLKSTCEGKQRSNGFCMACLHKLYRYGHILGGGDKPGVQAGKPRVRRHR